MTTMKRRLTLAALGGAVALQRLHEVRLVDPAAARVSPGQGPPEELGVADDDVEEVVEFFRNFSLNILQLSHIINFNSQFMKTVF